MEKEAYPLNFIDVEIGIFIFLVHLSVFDKAPLTAWEPAYVEVIVLLLLR